jgi:hypothetical protein
MKRVSIGPVLAFADTTGTFLIIYEIKGAWCMEVWDFHG